MKRLSFWRALLSHQMLWVVVAAMLVGVISFLGIEREITAQHAQKAATNRISQYKADAVVLNDEIKDLREHIGTNSADIAALQEQVRQLGGKPVVPMTKTTTTTTSVKNQPTQSPQSPAKASPGTTTPPKSTPNSTTTTTAPCASPTPLGIPCLVH